MHEIERLYKEYRAAKIANQEEQARKLMERINELRRDPRENTTFCRRDRITTRGTMSEADKLRGKAALFRFLIRHANAAEATGDRAKAERLRAKAKECAGRMTAIRRSATRTLDTPPGKSYLRTIDSRKGETWRT